MSHYYAIPLVDEAELAQARAALGADLTRILGYFREDGAKSIVQVEEALAAGDAATMVRPAHTLKGESRQFGCRRLGDIAEAIEMTARRCVEQHSAPDEVAAEVAMLRGCFTESIALLDGNAAPAPTFTNSPVLTRPVPTRPAAPAPGLRPRVFGRRTSH
ncbi:MAG: histidine phosphotransferase [Sphingobium sp. 66-54]|nr:MAG: histidine phosphotransferase [Sphingobium sp. 66-54]